MTTEKVANNIASFFAEEGVDNDFVFPGTIDDPMPEDPAMVMSAYSEILSMRIGYGGGELYDIFVAKVK